MYPIYHFILTVIASIFLFPILGWKILLFWLGSFFVDVDHYWWYILKFKDLSLKKAYEWCNLRSKGLEPGFDFHVFHLIEFWILMLIWSLFSEFGFIIFLGLIYHNVFDFVDVIVSNKIDRRALSFFEWIYSI